MTPLAILDSKKLSESLRHALSWDDHVASLMVSARNGSIIGYAFRGPTPIIKTLRTISTTMTTAYSATSDDKLIFQSPGTKSISVISPIGDHLLLAVTSNDQDATDQVNYDALKFTNANGSLEQEDSVDEAHSDQGQDDHEEPNQLFEEVREDLESISAELVVRLEKEFSTLDWPDDI